MATEATAGVLIDVSVNEPSLNQPIAAEPDFQNADESIIPVNGSPDEIGNKQIADIVDEFVNSAEASSSGGSDTEAFKADSSKLSDEKGHVRSSSTVKKPLSFKSVSYNRTFLASKSTINSTSRPDSAAGSASAAPQPTTSSSASRLKLVAKSGNALGSGSKALGVNGKPSGAPDPNLVWNRNRAPVPPEAKKRSDEELKHDGIHLADRLGPEDLKGQSNWADIDDDDEWAPDTITWTDGTKVTLPQMDGVADSPDMQHATVTVDKAPKRGPIPAPKPKSPAPPSNTSSSPVIRQGVLASGKGLVFKGAPEKPTLVAKPPPPPGPVKSPWATLPPIEKVAPGVVEAPSQMAPPRYPLREPSTKSATPPPTKEIAADDFSRNYRDGAMSTARELFNSQSGRYEPVSDRRGSRNDANARQPALLQRQTHHEQQGPAEPSAAFQTSRNSVQESPYSRRRGSSNVSGGSGHLAQRLAGKPHDMLPPPELSPKQGQALLSRTGSILSSAGSPISTQNFPATSTQANQAIERTHPPLHPSLVSPQQAHTIPHQNTYNQEPQQAPQQVDADWEKTQKEFMRKKREEAVKRRMDQEAREEAAKQARIAEKLKALGPAPERKSTKKALSGIPPSVPHRSELPRSLAVRSQLLSGTKSTDPVATEAPASEVKVENAVTAAGMTPNEPAEADLREMNGSTKPQVDYEQPRMPPVPPITNTHGQAAAPWSEVTAWNSSHQNPSRNVWGAPGNDRSLGNGTFNADIGPLPETHAATGTNVMRRPAPIAPPRTTPQAPKSEAQPGRLPPIGPPRSQPKPHNFDAWQKFDAEANDEELRQERIKQKEALGEDTAAPTFTDVWRPVNLNEEGRRTAVATYVQARGGPSSELLESRKTAPHHEGGRQPVGPPPTAGPSTGPAAQIRTGSRFIPPKDFQQHESSTQLSRSKSLTPPPPTADGHPVYDGDATKPHVALPPPTPIVKLPPSTQSAAPGPIAPPTKQPPVSFAVAAASNGLPKGTEGNLPGRPVSRGQAFNGIPQKPHEIASQENWQSKINNLMGKKSTSPPKFMPVGSSMIIPLESARLHDSTDVPVLSPSGTDSTEDSVFTSKEMAEECFGEQEMGSLPAVRLPKETPDAAWQAVQPDWSPTPSGMRVDPAGGEPYKFGPDIAHGRSVIRISIFGVSSAKVVNAPMGNHRSGSNPRRAAPRGGGPRHQPRPSRRGGRETNEHTGDHSTIPPSGRTVSGRGTRNFRSRGETWTRQMPSSSTAQS
ncbi:hypothetical protein F4777DRAFT_590496 [Nemania sp. FL0916]|nr:hypothetical protein F4777DRAFT_590496 [Nemania sp. FL0916]